MKTGFTKKAGRCLVSAAQRDGATLICVTLNDPDDWRDPWVIRDEEKEEYLLILGTRKAGHKTQQTGRTVKFSSKDLKDWKFEGDFWAPDLYTMHEMPDLFKMGDWWYHIVTEYSDRRGPRRRTMHLMDARIMQEGRLI